nr:eukaryotic translation initiation factor 2-alpha kinase 1-like isoform X2 [Procambarus clarkii]XP_045611796.1 eukaryotic translation initiation factor 2-alpha kinase 1-like isoform X2 [Procambarus clarkii]XP_045611797.1 eukaryotic translation initiation factor 2-alpha kinase 1-like isoform X2 [Procambarus clarkii]
MKKRRYRPRRGLASNAGTPLQTQVTDHLHSPSGSSSATAFDTHNNHRGTPQFNWHNDLPLLQPITSFSPMQGQGGDAAIPGDLLPSISRGIVNNSTVIEILVKLLCREREADPASREVLFKALCTVIGQCNSSLYLPLHAFPELQDFQANLIKQFEKLFENAQSQIPVNSANLVLPRLRLPASPRNQLMMTNSYRHLLDDRYTREFTEVEILGKGGFGVVVKAEHRLDGRFYAIKIIPVKDDGKSDQANLLREVTSLAQLDHPHIVRYHCAWTQLYVLPPHLSHSVEFNETLARKPRNPSSVILRPKVLNVSPLQRIRIEELSSSEEEDDSIEESSGGISFREETKAQSKPNLRSIGHKTCNGICEDAKKSLATREDRKIDKEISFYKRTQKNILSSVKSNEVLNNGLCESNSNLTHNLNKFINKESLNAKSSTDESKVFFENNHCKKKISSSSSEISLSLPFVKEKCTAALDCNSFSLSSSPDDICKKSVLPYRSFRNDLQQNRRCPPIARMTLFIQMGLCGKSLRDWLISRNETHTSSAINTQAAINRVECLSLFRQVLLAVKYIHSQKIIHRDIKPANIFFTLDGKNIQVGDFGLARSLPDLTTSGDGGADFVTQSSLTPISEHAPNTRGVGTPIYAAPELTSGGQYDEKSDMHNLGIILLELFQSFNTGSERIHVINKLKMKRHLNQDVIASWPNIASWILKLSDPEPSNRPSASEALESSLFKPPFTDERSFIYHSHDMVVQSNCSDDALRCKARHNNLSVIQIGDHKNDLNTHAIQESSHQDELKDAPIKVTKSEVCLKDIEIAKLKEESFKQIFQKDNEIARLKKENMEQVLQKNNEIAELKEENLKLHEEIARLRLQI